MLQQPLNVIDVPVPVIDVPVVVDVPVADEVPLIEHGAIELWTVLGNGLRPPVASSVDPMGIPARPTVDRKPLPGDEADADGLEDAVMPPAPPAHALELVPDMPVLSNNCVGADVPPIALLLPVIEVPLLEIPEPGVIASADVPIPEQVAAVIEPRGEVPAADGLTPGVASSVAPSGIPVVPTGAPGPIPSGEVTPSEGAPVTPTWANAGLQHNEADATAAIKERFMEASDVSRGIRLTRITLRDDRGEP